MLHYLGIAALLLAPLLNWSAAENPCSTGCLLTNIAKFAEEQPLASKNVTLTSLTVTNNTDKILTLTFRVPFKPTCELPPAMCKITVIQRLEAAKKQHILIPTTWETVDITDESAEPETHIVAGALISVPWKHYGRYAETDVLNPLEELTFTRNAKGHIVLSKSGVIIPEVSQST